MCRDILSPGKVIIGCTKGVDRVNDRTDSI